jgi:RNA polymerase sigma-70 factor (ECF subfamily)
MLWRLTVGGTVTDQDVYAEVRRPLMRFAASLVGPGAAADLVSEVVIATLERRSLSSLEDPKAYLMQAVLNRARSRGRQLSRERHAVARLGVASGFDHQFEGRDPSVVRAVVELPPQQRAAVFLVYWEDLSPSEAAEVLGVRPATLRRYLHLARQKLRRYLE